MDVTLVTASPGHMTRSSVVKLRPAEEREEEREEEKRRPRRVCHSASVLALLGLALSTGCSALLLNACCDRGVVGLRVGVWVVCVCVGVGVGVLVWVVVCVCVGSVE